MFSRCCSAYTYNDKINEEFINGMPKIIGRCLECLESTEFNPQKENQEQKENRELL